MNKKGNSSGLRRKAGQIELDRRDIALLYVQGYSIRDVWKKFNETREYNLAYTTVANELQNIREMWINHYLDEYDANLAKELAKIDNLEARAWEEWERSRRDLEEAEQWEKEHTGTNVTGKVVQTQKSKNTRVKKIKREGNVEYMRTIQWCIQQRCRILGLDAPQRIEVDWKSQARQAGIDNPTELFNNLVEKFVIEAEVE